MRRQMILLSFLLALSGAGCAASKDADVIDKNKILGQSSAAEIRKSMSEVKSEYSAMSNLDLQKKADATPQGNQTAISEFDKTLKVCQRVLAKYEKEANTYTYIRILLGVAGAAAGGIAVPALTAAAPVANKAAISSLGGVSGVTSGVLSQMSEGGLDAADALISRQKTRDEVIKALGDYFTALKESKPIDAGAALDNAKASCALYEITTPSSTSNTK